MSVKWVHWCDFGWWVLGVYIGLHLVFGGVIFIDKKWKSLDFQKLNVHNHHWSDINNNILYCTQRVDINNNV